MRKVFDFTAGMLTINLLVFIVVAIVSYNTKDDIVAWVAAIMAVVTVLWLCSLARMDIKYSKSNL